MSVQVCLTIFEVNFTAEVEFRITAPSYAGKRPDMNQPGEPAEGPEWEIDDITLRRDPPDADDPLYLPDWLYALIAEHETVEEAICDAEKDEAFSWIRG